MASLPMEGKLHADWLQSMDADDDMLTAMARDLVTRQGVGEGAAEVWRSLVVNHSSKQATGIVLEVIDAMPTMQEQLEPSPWIQSVGPMVQLSLF